MKKLYLFIYAYLKTQGKILKILIIIINNDLKI